jgi:ribosome-associated toxin RatA of RatAB toxin-antitoxin module
VTAKVHLHYAGVRHAFTTRNTHQPDRQVLMRLVDGPFSMLEGSWDFLPLGSTQEPPRPARSSSTCAMPSPAGRWNWC